MKKAVVIVRTDPLKVLVGRWLKEMGYETLSSDEPSRLTKLIDTALAGEGGIDLTVAEVGAANWLPYVRYMADKVRRIVVTYSPMDKKEAIEEALAGLKNVQLLEVPIGEMATFRTAVEKQ